MTNMPTVNGAGNSEVNHSGFYSSQPQASSSADGFKMIPLTSQQLVQIACSNSMQVSYMAEAVRERLRQQHENGLVFLPHIDNRFPLYIPSPAIAAFPVHDMQTIISRRLIDCLQNPTTIDPFLQSALAQNSIAAGRRMKSALERIKSYPDTARLVATATPYNPVYNQTFESPGFQYMDQNAQFQGSLQQTSAQNVSENSVPPPSGRQAYGNHEPEHNIATASITQTSSTLTTITEYPTETEKHTEAATEQANDINLQTNGYKELPQPCEKQSIATDTSDLSSWALEISSQNKKLIINPDRSHTESGTQHAEITQNGIITDTEAASNVQNESPPLAETPGPDASSVTSNQQTEGEHITESSPTKQQGKVAEDPKPKVITKVKMPSFSPSKSHNFVTSIRCEDIGQKFQPDPMKKKEYKFTRSESATELPFSILTIRDQRNYLKDSEDAFVQDAPCYDIARMYGVETSGPTVAQNCWCKCRECRSVKNKESLAVFCRFYGFRKLRFQNDLLCTAGFLYPEECVEKDLQLWLPQKRCFWEKSKDSKDVLSPNDPLDQTMSDFILLNIAKRFCDIVLREKKAMSWVEAEEIIFWKKPVAGVREMCDVCETTLFNMHWICRKCGYGVCLDCYERRMNKSETDQEEYDNDKTNCFRWARCTKGKYHFHSSMLPTQIIPSTCLLDLSDMVHSLCADRSIKTSCPCQKSKLPSKLQKTDKNHDHPPHTGVIVYAQNHDTSNGKNRKRKISNSSSDTPIDSSQPKSKENKTTSPSKSMDLSKQPTVCLVDLLSKETWEHNADVAKDAAQQRNWLCEGKLLQLMDSQHPSNIDVFKLHWKFGMPVLVSGCGNYLNMKLWLPDQISREYGDANSKNSLVNCVTGSIVTNMKIRDFWDGFENISQRLLDENNKTMILKLKDWPPTELFQDVMPEVYEDLMGALPLPEYTFINGKCNLASRLPHFFVKPDLGPKMYNAYGWVTETNWKQGTTNLHLDVSDAVNIMVYVGIPVDEPPEARKTLMEIVSEGEVDDIQYKRALEDKPGALWHIFHVNDVDKIRRFIRKVCVERGETAASDHDPIHDQQMYLDKELRHRLKEEYNVEGYAILQCQGDGVFIPAGAPHQVFNLHSCIKIAEDFVSPEHVDKCFTLTNEFRYLSSTHSNHEDKLQIKNIIYHSVKDIVSSAMHAHCT